MKLTFWSEETRWNSQSFSVFFRTTFSTSHQLAGQTRTREIYDQAIENLPQERLRPVRSAILGKSWWLMRINADQCWLMAWYRHVFFSGLGKLNWLIATNCPLVVGGIPFAGGLHFFNCRCTWLAPKSDWIEEAQNSVTSEVLFQHLEASSPFPWHHSGGSNQRRMHSLRQDGNHAWGG